MSKVKLKVMKKPERWRREKTESQMLGLIQCWADTFMMEEDQYPGFQKIYRMLRKEGVVFPMRDPNIRMFMGNICQSSPMFDFVEEAVGREVNPGRLTDYKKRPQPEKDDEEEKEPQQPDFAARYAKEFDESNIEHGDDGNENVMQLVGMNIT